jgi:hypothetical protein
MLGEKRSATSTMDIMGQRAPPVEDGSASGMRTAETMLRLVPMALCVAALVVMLKNSQTSDFGSLSYSDLGAFRYICPIIIIIKVLFFDIQMSACVLIGNSSICRCLMILLYIIIYLSSR